MALVRISIFQQIVFAFIFLDDCKRLWLHLDGVMSVRLPSLIFQSAIGEPICLIQVGHVDPDEHKDQKGDVSVFVQLFFFWRYWLREKLFELFGS